MLKAWLSPGGEQVDFAIEVQAKAAALHAAAEEGAKFLGLPVTETRDASAWILASFHSPICVVPLPPALPLPVLQARLSQLPSGTVIFPSSLTISRPGEERFSLKPLDQPWAIVFSSGSTGEPKGIVLSGSAIKQSALAHAAHTSGARACWLLDLPLFHVGGLSVLSRALFLGAEVALGGGKFDAVASCEWIESGLVQGLSLVPTTLFRLLQIEALSFSNLKIVLLGGAPADPELLKRAVARGVPVHLTYGMTEHCSQIATEKRPGIGLEALAGVEIKTSSEGEILVRSKCLASGFFSSGTFLRLALDGDGFFPTGDLGEIRNGKLHIAGRKSEIIITGGMKVFPAEIEREIARLDGISECAVFSLPDPEWGEVVCAAIVGREELANIPSWKSALAGLLEPKKIPKKWFLLDQLPRSATGKILRAELRALYSHS